MPKKIIAFCPECDVKVVFKRQPQLGQKVICRNCRTELEVVEVDPLELDLAFTAEAYNEPDDDKRDSFVRHDKSKLFDDYE